MTTASQSVPASTPGQTTAKRTRSKSRSAAIGKVAVFITLLLLSITWIFPLYWMVTSALKDDPQIYTVPPVMIPNPAYWNNFIDAWNRLDFNTAAFNSIFRYSLPVTIFTVVSSVMVAYGFSKIRWPGREALFWVCIATMMLPWQVTMVPLFIIFKQLGWINTYLPLVVPSLFGTPYFIFLLRQFFMSIPEELSEAARMEGASELRDSVPHPDAALQTGPGRDHPLPLYVVVERLPGAPDLHQPREHAAVGVDDLSPAHHRHEHGYRIHGLSPPDGRQHDCGSARHPRLCVGAKNLYRRHLHDGTEGLSASSDMGTVFNYFRRTIDRTRDDADWADSRGSLLN